MPNPSKKLLLLSIIIACLVVTTTAEVSDLDILIVNDGHSLPENSEFEEGSRLDRQMFSRYADSLKNIPGTRISSYNTSISGSGPNASEMADHDIVVWYFLADQANEHTILTSSDRENIRTYLNQHNGKIFLTGQKVQLNNLKNQIGAYFTGSFKYHENNDKEIIAGNMENNARGKEGGDPITGSQYQEYGMNTTLQNPSDRYFMTEICDLENSEYEYQLTDDTDICRIAEMDDSLIPYYSIGQEDHNYGLNYTDISGEIDDVTNSLVHSSRPRYKTVYMGVGFEAIEKETDSGENYRDYLMRNIVNYLAGPRMQDTEIVRAKNTVKDEDGESYRHYTNSTLNISTTCVNNQQTDSGTEENITDARMFYTLDGELGPALEDGFERDSLGTGWDKGSANEFPDYDSTNIDSYCGRNEGEKSLHLWEGDWNDDYQVTSPKMDLSKRKNVKLSYSIFFPSSDDGSCYALEDGSEDTDEDTIEIEYYSENDGWKVLQTFGAAGLDADKWNEIKTEIPEDGLHKDFRIRFDPKSTDDSTYYGSYGGDYGSYDDGGDTWAIDDVVVDDGYHMIPLDGEFNSSSERVQFDNFNATNVSVDLSNESLYYRGANFTYGVQCRGSTKNPQWSRFDTQWVNVDVLKPSSPFFVDFKREYSKENKTTAEIIYKYTDEDGREIRRPSEQRADIIRFKCSDEGWSEWKRLDKELKDGSKETQEIEVNISQKKCGTGDGNRSVTAQVSDFAGNIQQETVSDWIVLDTSSPNITDIGPENNSYINETEKIQVNGTDYKKDLNTPVSGIDPDGDQFYNNGTGENGSFRINNSFSQPFSQEEQQNLKTFIIDRVGNIFTTSFRFTVDLTDPVIDEITPGNQTVLTRDDDVTIKVSDTVSNVSYLSFYNGSRWINNETINSKTTSRTLNPGWTEQGQNVLKVRFNDTVGHTVEKEFVYYVDETPPEFLYTEPSNNSVFKHSEDLEAYIVDRYQAGIHKTYFSLNKGENNSFEPNKSFSPGWGNLEDGWHNITFWANDTLGFSNSAFYRYKLDSTPPNIISGIPPTDSYVNNSLVFTAEFEDETSNLSFIRLNNSTEWVKTSKIGDSNSYQETYSSIWKEEGEKRLVFEINDSADNRLEESYSPYYLDTTPPYIEKDSADPGNGSYITSETEISMKFSDPNLKGTGTSGSGVGIRLFNNGTGNYSFQNSFLPKWDVSERKTVDIWVEDNVNNTNMSTYHYLVDNLGPEIVEIPPDQTVLPSEPVIEISAQDRGAEGGVGTDSITLRNGTHNKTFEDRNFEYSPGWVSGEQLLKIWLVDDLGNTEFTSYTYFADNQPPETSTNHTYSGWRDTNKTVSVNMTDNYQPDSIFTCISDISENSCRPEFTASQNTSVEVGCTENQTCVKHVYHRANDSVGNLEDTKTSTNISIDRERPRIVFNNPTDGDRTGSIITFDTSIDDVSRDKGYKGSGVLDANYSIINRTENVNQVIKTGDLNETENWNVAWNSSIQSIGNFSFNVSAVDVLGNSVEKEINFTVDNQAPTVSISYDPSKLFHSKNFEVTVSARRGGQPTLKNISYTVYNQSDQQPVKYEENTGINADEDSIISTFAVPEEFLDGNYTINATAWDDVAGGNSGEASREFKIDTERPSASIDSPENETWQKGTVSIGYAISDNRGIDTCKRRYRDSEKVWSSNRTIDCSGDSFSFDTNNCIDNNESGCRVEIIAEDKAGNTEREKIFFKVDNSPPTAEILSPASGAWFNDDFELTYSFEDQEGVKKVERKNTGSSWVTDSSGEFIIPVGFGEECGTEGEKICQAQINVTNNVNTSTLVKRNFSIDLSLPEITDVSPVNTTNLTSGEKISLSFRDTISSIKSSQTKYSNGTHNSSLKSGQAFNPEWQKQGKNSVRVWIVDQAGNTLSENYVFTLDDFRPVITDSTPSNNTEITPEENLRIDGFDNITGIEDSRYYTSSASVSFPMNTTFQRNWGGETVGYRWLNITATDFSDNTVTEKFRYFVDGVPPEIILDSPENGSVIRLDSEFRINTTDRGVGSEENGTYTEENQEISFRLNKSHDPEWDFDYPGEGVHWIEVSVSDIVGNQDSRNYMFILDGTPPQIGQIDTNKSFTKPGEKVSISSEITDTYSDVDTVSFRIINDTGTTLTTITPSETDNIYSTEYTVPDISTQNITINITAEDSTGHQTFRTSEKLRVDSKKPENTGNNLNISTDEVFGDLRIYRNKAVRLEANFTDDTKVEKVIATVKNPVSEENRTLEKFGSDNYALDIPDTEKTGIYNISRIYAEDIVGNTKKIMPDLVFHVVNHSLNVSHNFRNYTHADFVEKTDIVVDLNMSLSDPEITVETPHNTSEDYLFRNESVYSCEFGDSCKVNKTLEGKLRITGDGSGRFINVSSDLRAPSPVNDKYYTWSSRVFNTQKKDTKVRAPNITINNVFCNSGNDCSLDQFKEENITVSVENVNDENHSGHVNNLSTKYSFESSRIQNSFKKSLDRLETGSRANISGNQTFEEAGILEMFLEAYDNKTGFYRDTKTKEIIVKDLETPSVDSNSIDNNITNLQTAINFETTVRDNDNLNIDTDGVDNIKTTVRNATGNLSNISLGRVQGGKRDRYLVSDWEGTYTDTSRKGVYNFTRIFLEDHEGNTYTEPVSTTFRVVNLGINASTNPKKLSVEEPVTIGANVSGNVVPVEKITANISKPRNYFETVELEKTGPESVNDFETIYHNSSRTGNYKSNITVKAGNSVYNGSQGFEVAHGQPNISNAVGNGSHVVLSEDINTYNLTWRIDAEDGDLIDTNTSVHVNDTGIIQSSGKNFQDLGNITFEEGYQLVDFNFSTVQTGKTDVVLSVNHSETDEPVNKTLNIIVNSSEIEEPRIQSFRESKKVVNQNEAITISTNIASNTVLRNNTLTVVHPEGGTGYIEPSRKMEKVSRKEYNYLFTNTSEPGHYTYNITSEDYTGNIETNQSKSFNVTDDYEVDIIPDHSIYKKGDTANFEVVVRDTNGEEVDGFNQKMVLYDTDKNRTLIDNQVKTGESYDIESEYPPLRDDDSDGTVEYKLFVNVSKDGNKGISSETFEVTRIIDIEFVEPPAGDYISPGSEFTLEIQITGPRGNPINFGTFFANCEHCVESPKRLSLVNYKGTYRTTLKAKDETSEEEGISVTGSDFYSNSESQENTGAPFRVVNFAIQTNQTGGTAPVGGGGGGGGGGALPSTEIERLSPPLELESDVSETNLSVRTNMESECRYGENLETENFDSGYSMITNDGLLHYAMVSLPEPRTYAYNVICRSGGQYSEREIVFSLGEEEISTYDLRFPSEIGPVTQGDSGNKPFSVYNNGTETLNLSVETESECCETWVERDEERLKHIIVEDGAEISQRLFAKVPLYVPEGEHEITVTLEGERTRERTLPLIVSKNPMRVQLEELQSQMESLKETIDTFNRTGVPVKTLYQKYEQLGNAIENSETAIQNDHKSVLSNQINIALNHKKDIDAEISAKRWEANVRQNWWKWLLEFIAAYTVFFLVTMVFVPYYRTRSELINAKQELEGATEARKKAEKQYFKRQIDRDTFMKIMTERQDEVLELRGEIEDIEKELETVWSDRLTLKNYVKAPVKAFRELVRLFHTFSDSEKNKE